MVIFFLFMAVAEASMVDERKKKFVNKSTWSDLQDQGSDTSWCILTWEAKDLDLVTAVARSLSDGMVIERGEYEGERGDLESCSGRRLERDRAEP